MYKDSGFDGVYSYVNFKVCFFGGGGVLEILINVKEVIIIVRYLKCIFVKNVDFIIILGFGWDG